jgi:SAM-dependent methyltransferase
MHLANLGGRRLHQEGKTGVTTSDDKPQKTQDARPPNPALAGVFKITKTEVQKGDGYVLHVYDDYETYRKVQEEGNKAKIKGQFVKEGHIQFLAEWMTATLSAAGSGPVTFGLCHGVRRGREQAWFAKHLAGASVIGTDISETAKDFVNTVQWDFHAENPEWDGKCDFVYSNSWDHAYDPAKAFRAWAKSLKPGGWILIDHTKFHGPKTTNLLDPFGATQDATIRILNESCADLGRVTEVLDRSEDAIYPCHVIVFTRT